MGSLSGLGIGLSFVLGFILMGVVAELYYWLWWKKRIADSPSDGEDNSIKDFSFLFCWKKPNSNQEITNSVRNPQEQEDLELGSTKDFKGYGEEGVETELMRMHNLSGPPRFLFTIKEECKEDLESEDGKSRGDRSSRKGSRTRSLSHDLVFPVDGMGTPFLTPLSSPTVKILNPLDSFNNPLFESLSEAELNRLRSSPPPKFKFLLDAEDKFIRRTLMEENDKMRDQKYNNGKIQDFGEDDEKDVSFVSFIDRRSLLVRDQIHNQASQVLPLPSSPTFDKPVPKKNDGKY